MPQEMYSLSRRVGSSTDRTSAIFFEPWVYARAAEPTHITSQRDPTYDQHTHWAHSVLLKLPVDVLVTEFAFCQTKSQGRTHGRYATHTHARTHCAIDDTLSNTH